MHRLNRFRSLLIALILCALWSRFSNADEAAEPRQHAWLIDFDDDTEFIFGPGTDQAYTGGYRFAYLSEEKSRPRWLKSTFIDPADEAFKATSGYLIGQQLYTPDNIHTSEPIANDRPYAAWLYLGLTSTYMTSRKSHLLEFDIGYVGPRAEGGAVQNGVHRVIGNEPAQGWANQIRNEPTLQLYYQMREKHRDFFSASSWHDLDVIPYYGMAIGNVAVKAHAGAFIRFSFGELPPDFGPTRANSEDGDSFVPLGTGDNHSHAIAFFAGVRLTAVGKNIFLDGNTFRASPRVTKFPLVAMSDVGLGKQWQTWSLVWRYVTYSPEFAENPEFNSFASITLMHSYSN